MRWIPSWLLWILPGPSVARRPQNPVDERLMRRVKAQGRSVNDVLAVRGREAVERERRKELRRRALREGDFERAEKLGSDANRN